MSAGNWTPRSSGKESSALYLLSHHSSSPAKNNLSAAFPAVEFKPRALHMLDQYSTHGLHLQPEFLFSVITV